MSQEHDRETIERLTQIAVQLGERDVMRQRQADEAYAKHMQAVAVIAGTLFVVGGVLVIVITGRPVLLILVAVVCVVGYAVNIVNARDNIYSRRA